MKTSTVVVLIVAVVITFCSSAEAQQAQQAQDYQAITDKFFTMLKQGKTAEAIDYMFSLNPAFEKMSDKRDQLKAQFGGMQQMLGAYVGNYKLIEAKVTPVFVYQHYFVAYERQPISLRIRYYKPHDKWLVEAFNFNTDLDDEIQKQADERLPLETK